MAPGTSADHNEGTRVANRTTSTFRWAEDEEPILTIVETVASVNNADPVELEPLSHVVDTDALSSVFAPTVSTDRGPGRFRFEYEGCHVQVTASGEISVTPISK